MTTQPTPESAEPAPVATDTQVQPATPAPAGDAEVSHEQARSIIREAWDAPVSLKDCLLKLRRYIDQREADDRAARRDLEDMRERRRVERVRAADAEIALTEERSRSAELSRKLETAERALNDFESPACSGEWLSGSGGHRVFGGCNKPATWVETEGGAAACDEHLVQHVRRAAGDGWVDPAKSPPLVDTFAWVVWNGTVQRQPWEWVNTDEDEQLWHFDGHTLPADEVDAYLPLRLPAPPSDSGKGE